MATSGEPASEAQGHAEPISTGHARTARASSSALPQPTQKTTMVSEIKPASPADSQPVVLGLLAVAVVLVLAGVFSDRISEIGVLGVTIKLVPAVANAMREIRTRTPNDDATDNALDAFMSSLSDQAVKKRNLTIEDVNAAKETALAEYPEISDEISVEKTPQGVRVTVTPQGTQARRIAVTTNGGLLPGPLFGEGAQVIEAADPDLGRRLYALDTESEEVMAALSYELIDDPPEAPVVIDALTTHSGAEQARPALVCAGILVTYLHALAAKLERDGVVMRLTETPSTDEQRKLWRLGFRPALGADSALPAPGVYWRHEG